MPQLTNAQARDVESLLHPVTNLAQHRVDGPLVIESGESIYVYDNEGRRYVEGLAGLWCVGLGFGNEEMAETAREQISRLSYGHLFGGRSNENAIALAEKIKDLLPVPMAQVFFACSGSEANDTQVKLAWYKSNARGETARKKVLARKNGYHGVTVIAGSATGIPRFHADFDLPVRGVLHLTAPHYWKEAEDGETEEDFTRRLSEELEDAIQREGPETICAYIAEPVIGAGGVIFPPKGYFEAVGEILARYGIDFIDDEVICGFGRTGNWFGAETYGMRPTSFSMAKQLTSGYAPLSAVAIDRETADILEEQSRKLGIFAHGFTYGGHPVATALGLKAIEIYEREGIIEHVRRMAPLFQQKAQAFAEHPLVGEVRADGNGLIAGIEVAADRKAKRSFQPVGKVGAAAMDAAARHGVLIRAIGDTLAICPPMTIREDGIEEIFSAIGLALDETEAWVAREGLRDA